MPCWRNKALVDEDVDTAPLMSLPLAASASIKYFTVEPVPTPMYSPCGTSSSALCAAMRFKSSCVAIGGFLGV